MLSDYMEAFTLLRLAETDDGMGGTAVTWTEDAGGAFRGGVTAAGGRLEGFAGGVSGRAQPMLVHDRSVRLRPRMLVKRVRDGAVFRTLGDSTDMETPARMRPAFAQVPVERREALTDAAGD